MKEDIVKIIKAFDGFLDNMYDRGAFDPTEKEDMELEKFIGSMKKKYLSEKELDNYNMI